MSGFETSVLFTSRSCFILAIVYCLSAIMSLALSFDAVLEAVWVPLLSSDEQFSGLHFLRNGNVQTGPLDLINHLSRQLCNPSFARHRRHVLKIARVVNISMSLTSIGSIGDDFHSKLSFATL